jgi:hypothetical protein
MKAPGITMAELKDRIAQLIYDQRDCPYNHEYHERSITNLLVGYINDSEVTMLFAIFTDLVRQYELNVDTIEGETEE